MITQSYYVYILTFQIASLNNDETITDRAVDIKKVHSKGTTMLMESL